MGESNPNRRPVALFGAFWLVVLVLRQQNNVLRTKNPSKVPRQAGLCRFRQANFYRGEEDDAGHTPV